RSIENVERASVLAIAPCVPKSNRLILVGLVEGQRLALTLAGSGEGQPAVLIAFTVEEDDAGARFRSAPERIRLAADHGIGHPRPVGQRHAERSVFLDDVDALDVDLLEMWPLRRRDQDDAERAEREGFTGGWDSH